MGVDGLPPPADEKIVKGVLDERARVGGAEDAFGVRLILCEQQFLGAVAMQDIWAQLGMLGGDGKPASHLIRLPQKGLDRRVPQPPSVPEPEVREDVQRGFLRAAVEGRDPDQQVIRRRLGILDKDVEVPVVVEDPRVEQFVFHLLAGAAAVRLDQIAIGKGRLGVLVKILHVGMRGRAVEIEIVFLDILPVVALGVRQAEEALLQNRVLSVPQGQGEAEPLLVVADARQAVLAPPVGPGARLVVGEVAPGVAILAVILAHRAPLPLAEIRPPLFPGHALRRRFLQALALNRNLGGTVAHVAPLSRQSAVQPYFICGSQVGCANHFCPRSCRYPAFSRPCRKFPNQLSRCGSPLGTAMPMGS